MGRAAIISTNLVYAPTHEFGAVIVPRRARFLRFEIDGQVIFAKRVVIPARPFMRPGFDTSKHRAIAEVKRVLALQIQHVGRS